MSHTNFSRACAIVFLLRSVSVCAESTFILHEKGYSEKGAPSVALFQEKDALLAESKLDAYLAENSPLQNSPHHLSLEETLHLRRISAYWREKKFANAKSEISNFFELFPSSPVKDPLYAMLGDLYFHEKGYEEAVNTYSKIGSDEYNEKVFLHKLRALYELKKTPEVIREGLQFLSSPVRTEKSTKDQITFLTAESIAVSVKETPDLELARKGKALYENLKGTRYEEASLYPLSQLHSLLGEYGETAEIYLRLADRFPNKKEEILFQVAQLQLKFDKEEAAKTYLRICDLQGTKASVAAYNLFTLLFEAKNYVKVIEAKEELFSLIAPEQKATVEWYIGWSYYSERDYKNASSYLDRFAASETGENEQFKTALLSLVNCAEKQRDLPLFNKTISLLKTYYKEDPAVARALLIRAQLSADRNELGNSLEDLREISASFPDFEERETVAFNYALLLSQNKQWEESHTAFYEFLQKYPSSDKAKPAFRQMLFVSIQILKENPEKKEAFSQDLEWVLAQDEVLNKKEREEYSFVLIKTLYELERYEKAEAKLEEYFTSGASENLADAHLLMAMCEKKRVGLNQVFLVHAQKALELRPSLAERENIHLELFNACLQMGLLDEAAEYLHQAAKRASIKQENTVWLANYYYEKAKDSSCRLSLERAILYREATSRDETSSLKLAFLYGKAGRVDKEIELLKDLRAQQQQNPGGGWKYQRQTLFELAKAYEVDDQVEKALEIYESLADLKIGSSSLSNAALLQKTRLKYALLPTERKNEKDEECAEILNVLKDLELGKQLSSEPVHLEAALDYAQILSSISEPKEACYLHQLRQIKEDFASQENPFVKDYHSSAERYPEKEAIVNKYLSFLEAEIYRCEALLPENAGAKAKELKETALAQLEQLHSDETVNKELKNRIATSMRLLNE